MFTGPKLCTTWSRRGRSQTAHPHRRDKIRGRVALHERSDGEHISDVVGVTLVMMLLRQQSQLTVGCLWYPRRAVSDRGSCCVELVSPIHCGDHMFSATAGRLVALTDVTPGCFTAVRKLRESVMFAQMRELAHVRAFFVPLEGQLGAVLQSIPPCSIGLAEHCCTGAKREPAKSPAM